MYLCNVNKKQQQFRTAADGINNGNKVMNATMKSQMKSIMAMAWQFVKKNGYTMSEALKTAWRNAKVVNSMKTKITKFWFEKVNGELREAYGRLYDLPPVESNRKPNPSVQVYFDCEKDEFRCFKRANLVKVAM